MTKIWVVYESTEGHTKNVAKKIADRLNASHCTAKAIAVKDASAEMLANADGVILGGSIHMGKNNGRLVRFAAKHQAVLTAKPTELFLICLTARETTSEARAMVSGFFDEFSKRSGFAPLHSAAFAGALLYTKYNFIKRAIMKGIAEKQGGDTDVSRDFVYTDWEAVDRFADEFLERLNAFT